jgi:hypothetical protein
VFYECSDPVVARAGDLEAYINIRTVIIGIGYSPFLIDRFDRTPEDELEIAIALDGDGFEVA